ncbi:hypothetical protein AA0115_g5274 [Alternaria tenuissima]|uniref:BTB domain-containing protein n=1 Tax=Alternaria tenuissima TaxID=119927 RepID=A0AB37WMC2_9PLEO|nr:hypothetical protein AA0115_g5274 [Alternaria tenuissima]
MSSSSGVVLRHSMAAGSNTIVVKVGSDGKEYNLHTGLLIHHSGYFRGALSGAFRETDDGVVPLPDVDTDVFDVFVDWAYQGTLREDLEYIRHSYKSGLATACRAYVLADRLLAPGLKSALIDACFDKDIHNLDRWYPSCRRVIHAYEHLAENDPLLRLYVDLWAISNIVYKMDAYDKVLMPDLPKAFLVHLLRKMNEVGYKPLLRSRLERKHYNEVVMTRR